MHNLSRQLSLALFYSVFLGCVVLTAYRINAQPQRYRFERLSIEDGLPGTVDALFQDSRGFLWFSINTGLARYDGTEFTVLLDSMNVYRFISAIFESQDGHIWIGNLFGGLNRLDPLTGRVEPYQLEPLGSSGGNSFITEDVEGGLWVVRGDGSLDRFDPESGSSTHFGFDRRASGALRAPVSVVGSIPAVHIDRNGTLWVGTQGGGLHYFDASREMFTVYRPNPESMDLASDTVTVVYERPSEPGVLWIGTHGNGFFRLDTATGGLRQYRQVGAASSSLSNDFVDAILEDRKGRLWVVTNDLQLNLLEESEGQNDPFVFTRYPLPEHELASAVFQILVDRTGMFWISAGRDLLYAFDPDTGLAVTYSSGDGSDFSTGTGVPVLLEDQTGILWVGPHFLNKLDRWNQQFRSYSYDPDDPNSLTALWVESFYDSPDGAFWIGSYDGKLYRLDRRTDSFSSITIPFSQACRWSMVGDDEGNFWCSSDEGLLRIDPETGHTRPYRHDAQDSTSLSDDQVLEVYLDKEGTLWVGTETGLDRFDRARETFTRFQHRPDDAASLPGYVVFSVFEDRAGTLWVDSRGTEQRDWLSLVWADRFISRFNRSTGNFQSYSIPAGAPDPEYAVDSRGTLWIPTDLGLYRLDPSAPELVRAFSNTDGLPVDNVHGVLEDDAGWLWISTTNGLCRFNPATREFHIYDVRDGLPSNRFVSASYRLHSGEMAFGTNNGFVLFDPDRIVPHARPPAVHLTGLRLFDEPVVPGKTGPLPVPVGEAGEIRLHHDENDVTIEYVGLHFSRPERIRYRYMLEGYESGWREAGSQRRAVYPNLPPGDYTFRVTAANADGLWNAEGASIRVVVLPPWWWTTGAFLFYGILFLAGIFALTRWQQSRLLEKEREKTRQKELEQAQEIESAYHKLAEAHTHLQSTQAQLIQREKLASLGQLTAGIAHEIKNPLNFVNNFAATSNELAQEISEAAANGNTDEVRALAADLRLTTSKIEEHGKRADGIVRSMLLHAKGTTGEHTKTNLNALVDESVNLAYHSFRAQVPDFNCTIEKDLDQSVGAVEIITQEIGRVFLNLLQNAFYAVYEKATKSNGQYTPRVKLSTKCIEDQVEIRIEDNGPGIPDEIREKIFEPFFTTKPTGQGTGLGLSLAYDIVTQGHGGKLELESHEGQGTVFSVRIPAQVHVIAEGIRI